jgi:hypothetical protein
VKRFLLLTVLAVVAISGVSVAHADSPGSPTNPLHCYTESDCFPFTCTLVRVASSDYEARCWYVNQAILPMVSDDR